jgi:hypothetical protein
LVKKEYKWEILMVLFMMIDHTRAEDAIVEAAIL